MIKNISIFAKVIISYRELDTNWIRTGYELDSAVEGYDNLLSDFKVIDDVRTIQLDFKKQVQE